MPTDKDANYQEFYPRFSTRDHGIAFLAAEAAIDIGNFISNRANELSSVKHLSRLILETTQGENPRVRLPDYIHVLAYAIPGRKNYESYWKGKSVDDCVSETREIAENLRDIKNLPREEQERLGDFCGSLSQELIAYSHQYSSYRSRLVA